MHDRFIPGHEIEIASKGGTIWEYECDAVTKKSSRTMKKRFARLLKNDVYSF